jgi:cupin fold WbuC family metalloprotein
VELIKRLDHDLLARVADQARTSDRLRQNYNFHAHDEKVQRFLNVFQPGTYVRPHQHLRSSDSNGFEFFLVVQGGLGMLLFDSEGQVIHQETLKAQGPTKGIELAEGAFHTLVALAPDTVILELKEGPYVPSNDKNFLPQFPQEGTSAASECVRVWEQMFI